MPDQYEHALWFDGDWLRNWLPHSYVFRWSLSLQVGKTYHFQTRNLHSWFFGPTPDPVMYLVRGNDIVAYNDDYTALASEIIYTPTVSGYYMLIIRAYTTNTPGFCDLYQGIDGAQPSLLMKDVKFGGTYIRARWKLGEWFETDGLYFKTDGGAAADPYLFLIYPSNAVGSKMYMDDDGSALGLNAKIVPPTGGVGTVILGSFSRYSDGQCLLGLVGQSYKAPWLSPAPWRANPNRITLTPNVEKYINKLKQLKPSLNKLSPDKRDERALKLQREMLSEEEIRQQSSPAPTIAPDLARCQEEFIKRYKQAEKDLVKMPYSERTAILAQLKREVMGREYSEPEER